MTRTIAFLLALVLCGCGPRATEVTVRNDSSTRVMDVRVSGRGFAVDAGSIDPGQSRVVSVVPAGETGLAVSFRIGTHRVSVPQQGYFEGGRGYAVSVQIRQDLSVAVTAGPGGILGNVRAN